ncbi:MAG: sugar O-acetyltransferase [Dethiobacteria bacterium]|nr:sugar O-acetyltransferase [Bacillota bacterium]NMD33384.1 sugar O-acetyltransferase [Bacillota bacterium]HOB29298.1 sugar O-acetyltransferase [Bacillota bacterium]HPZ41983.1 sugar O-acetyltransferase [Bacillota bacterium]HQD52779.1 sugar O-acetyltransferase [Bacillota bacterium]
MQNGRKSEKEKMLAGELYLAADAELTGERDLARKLLWAYNQSRPGNMEKRNEILKRLIKARGAVYIEPPFYCDYGYNIEVGENFYANFNCVILDVNSVRIGDNVLLGPNVQIYTATHPLDPAERLTRREMAKPVVIGDNVWIGGGAIICPGVRIGAHSTIGPGSVVTGDIPAYVFAAGNPCKVIRML